MKKVMGFILMAGFLSNCNNDDEKNIPGCLFTFAGKEYRGEYATCTEIPDPNWNPSAGNNKYLSNTYLVGRISENDATWEIRINDGKEWGGNTLSFYDESVCVYVQYASIKSTSFSDGTMTFSGSDFENFFGQSCAGEIQGKCNCSSIR